MQHQRRCFLAALLLLLAGVAASAREVPYLTGRVMDQAGMIPDDVEARIEAKLEALERETGSQVAVLTLPSLDGDPLEDFSIRVVETWKLGREGVDDGALLLIAQQERKMRIEVGYGLEGALTDAVSRRILDNFVTPHFRAGDFGGGVEAGIDATLAVIRGEGLPAPVARDEREPVPCLVAFLVFVVLLVLLIWLLAPMRRQGSHADRRGWSSRRGWGTIVIPSGRGGGGWGGGGGGGGGFSGGGGGFGGGGASGGW